MHEAVSDGGGCGAAVEELAPVLEPRWTQQNRPPVDTSKPATRVAVDHPERVNRLVLVDASGYPTAAVSMPIGFRLAQIPALRPILASILPRSMILSSVRNVYGHPERVTPELVDRYFDLTLRAGNRKALGERFRQNKNGEFAAQVKQVRIGSGMKSFSWMQPKTVAVLVIAGPRFRMVGSSSPPWPGRTGPTRAGPRSSRRAGRRRRSSRRCSPGSRASRVRRRCPTPSRPAEARR